MAHRRPGRLPSRSCSAVGDLVQYRARASPALAWFPIDPFFALIGLTYALTVVWTLTLRFVDRHPG